MIQGNLYKSINEEVGNLFLMKRKIYFYQRESWLIFFLKMNHKIIKSITLCLHGHDALARKYKFSKKVYFSQRFNINDHKIFWSIFGYLLNAYVQNSYFLPFLQYKKVSTCSSMVSFQSLRSSAVQISITWRKFLVLLILRNSIFKFLFSIKFFVCFY